MKRITLLALLVCAGNFAFAQFNKQADSLLTNKQYFLLDEFLKSKQAPEDKMQQLYYSAFIHNFYNKPEESNKAIQSLTKGYSKKLAAKHNIELIKLQIDNDVKSYNYKAAYLNSNLLLTKYKADLDAKDAEDIANSMIIWKSLQATAPLRTEITKDTRIPYTRDLAKLLTVAVTFDNYTDNYVFDTGANISVITETNARKGHLTLMNDVFEVNAITGLKIKARTGVASEFKIGDVVVKNAVFLVFPDSALSFANGQYKIPGIIGFPIIEQLKEIRISKSGYMDVPANPSKMDIKNFGLDGLTPVVNVKYNNDMLPFTFDTGAQNTFLNPPFYTRYKAEIEAAGKAEDMRIGGAGGSNTLKSYKIPSFSFQLHDKNVNLSNLSVKTSAVGTKDAYYYGNMGQDVFKQFDELLINFKYMFVRLINLN